MTDIPAELEAVAGPLKGSIIPLQENEISIGREPLNQVSLLDAAVSRRHCVITRNAGQFKIQDLNSRNSTFVNGVPVTDRTLASGDEIKIGNSLFVFVLPEVEQAKNVSTSVEFDKAVDFDQGAGFDKADSGGGSTIILRKQDARYLRDLVDVRASSRTLADLNALLRISKAVNSVRGLEALEKQVLESIFEVRGHRAAIFWANTAPMSGPRCSDGIAGLGRTRPCKSAARLSREYSPMAWQCSVMTCRQPKRSPKPPAFWNAASTACWPCRWKFSTGPGSHLSGRLQSGGALRRESSATAHSHRQHSGRGARQRASHGSAGAGKPPFTG